MHVDVTFRNVVSETRSAKKGLSTIIKHITLNKKNVHLKWINKSNYRAHSLLVRKPEKAQFIQPPITIIGNMLVTLPFNISVIMLGSGKKLINVYFCQRQRNQKRFKKVFFLAILRQNYTELQLKLPWQYVKINLRKHKNSLQKLPLFNVTIQSGTLSTSNVNEHVSTCTHAQVFDILVLSQNS